jgi:LysM repeat protein
MSNVEKYGLLVLFILCAVILGIGVFGDTGPAKSPWQAREAAAKLVDRGKSEEPVVSADRQQQPEEREGEKPRLEPDRERDETFPPESSGPRILDRKPVASDVRTAPGSNVAPVATDDRIKVLPRDTFTSIAVRELGSDRHVEALMKANPDIDPRRLMAGMLLRRPKIDPPRTTPEPKAPTPQSATKKYRVQPGDSLARLSRKFYGSSKHVDHLARANGMRATDVLQAKREILVPPAPGKTDGDPAKAAR